MAALTNFESFSVPAFGVLVLIVIGQNPRGAPWSVLESLDLGQTEAMMIE